MKKKVRIGDKIDAGTNIQGITHFVPGEYFELLTETPGDPDYQPEEDDNIICPNCGTIIPTTNKTNKKHEKV